MKEAAEVCNQIAPEHVELSVQDPETLMADIRHAGAIFLGRYTSSRLVIIALDQVMSCRLLELQDFLLHWGFMIFRNAPRS